MEIRTNFEEEVTYIVNQSSNYQMMQTGFAYHV